MQGKFLTVKKMYLISKLKFCCNFQSLIPCLFEAIDPYDYLETSYIGTQI